MIDFEKISKARSLFKERGAIRREYIRDEIAYSWVRSRLYSKKKVEFLDEETRIFVNEVEYTSDEIIEFIDKNINIDKENCSIFIVGNDGKIKNIKYKNTILGIKTPDSFREEQVGTNGIGIAFSLKKSVIVYGSEHYNDEFDDYVSASLLEIPIQIDKGVFGIIAKKGYFRVELIDEIKNLNYDLIEKIKNKEDENHKDDRLIVNEKEKNKEENREEKLMKLVDNHEKLMIGTPYCLIGKSKEKVKLRELIMGKVLTSPIISIYGDRGSGKEYLARFIHENSSRRSSPFIRLNPKTDIEYVMDSEVDKFQSGTLYIENINDLNRKTIAKIQRKMNCKLINSSSGSDCNNNVFSIIFANEYQGEEIDKSMMLLTSLKVEIESIKSSEDDLQYLILKLIEKKLKETKGIKNLEIFSPIYIHDKSKEVLKELLLAKELSYRTLEMNINKIVKITSKSIEVNQLKDDSISDFKKIELKTLSDLELEYIKKIMEYTGDNVAKASEILGIGRTTIYRKLKSVK